MKKLLSIILAILMIVTTIPMAFAADIRLSGSLAGGNGKYELETGFVITETFEKLSEYLNKLLRVQPTTPDTGSLTKR